MIYTPFAPTALSDLCYILGPNHRQYPHTGLCAKIEMKFMDCLEAYGSNRVRDKCSDILYDMIECSYQSFQIKRAQTIRKERMRQYRAGKLDKPFVEYPPLDSYLYI